MACCCTHLPYANHQQQMGYNVEWKENGLQYRCTQAGDRLACGGADLTTKKKKTLNILQIIASEGPHIHTLQRLNIKTPL